MHHMESDETRLHLAVRMALGSDSEDRRLVIVVDQFEEVFTLQPNDAKSIQASRSFNELSQLDPGVKHRKAFIDNLMYAATIAGGKTIVLLTMRADFYGKCASFSNLAAALSEHQDLVGPMTTAELREVIERPAQLVGLELERGLTEMLLRDMAYQPGALPLLQHALWELWQQRQGRRLTIAAYESIGGLEGALEKQANEVFETFTADEKEVCRRIFLRLTQPGEGSEDTKRRVAISQIGDSPATKAVIQRLMNVRLITAESLPNRPNEAFVEVSHEALIRNWPRLRNWVDEDREALRSQHRLTEAALEWQESKRDPSFLYQGARLANAEEWSRTPDSDLTPLESEFLAASLEQRDRGKTEERDRQARELDTLKKLAASEHDRATEQAAAVTRSTHFLRASLALSTIALAAFFWAVIAQRKAVESARLAEVAKREAVQSERSAREAQGEAETYARKTEEVTQAIQEEYALNLLERISPIARKFGFSELPAFWRIAGLPHEREDLRDRILSIGLNSSDDAIRIAVRAPYFAQSLVGLNRNRRDKFLKEQILPLLKQRATDPTIRLACIRLGIALHVEGVDFAEQAIHILTKTLVETDALGIQDALGEDLKIAVQRIPGTESRRAVIPVVEAMQQSTDLRVLRILCNSIADDPPRILPIDGHRIVDHLMTVMEQPTRTSSQIEILSEFHECLSSLPQKLEIVDVERMVKLLVKDITSTGKPEIRDSLCNVASAAVSLFSPTQCRQAAGLFQRAMSDATESQDAQAFAHCLTSVANQLSKTEAGRAIVLLTRAMQKTNLPDPLQMLAEGIIKFPEKFTDDDARTAIARLVQVMEGTKGGRKLKVLSEAISLFNSTSVQTSNDLDKAKQVLLGEIQSIRITPDLSAVVTGLASLPIQLSEEESIVVVDSILNRLDKVISTDAFVMLRESLRLIGAKITPAAVEKVAALIINSIKNETVNSEKILALAHGLRGLERNQRTLVSSETITNAYRVVLSKMSEKDLSTPRQLSFLAQSLEIIPGDTTEEFANAAIRILQQGLLETDNPAALEFYATAFGALGGDVSASVGLQSVRQIIQDIDDTTDTDVRRVLIFGLAALAINMDLVGMFPESESQVLARHLIYAMDVTDEHRVLLRLADALSRFAPKLKNDDPELRQAIRQIRISMDSTKDPDVIAKLAETLKALANRLTPGESHEALLQLLREIKLPGNKSARAELKDATVAIIRTSRTSEMPTHFLRLLSVIQNDLDPPLLEIFLTGLKTLAAMIAPDDVDQAKQSLLAVMTSHYRLNDQVMNGLIHALDAFPGDIDTRELVEILKFPFCTGLARTSLLKIIEAQTNLYFDGNPWNVVDKAGEAGLDPKIFLQPTVQPASFRFVDSVQATSNPQ